MNTTAARRPTATRSITEQRKDARAAARWSASLPTMAEIQAKQAALLAARAAKAGK